MSFLQVGPLELMVILAIAILVLGPQRMLEIIRTLGRWTAQLRRFSQEFASNFQADVLNTETDMDENQGPGNLINDIVRPITEIRADLRAVEREAQQTIRGIADGGNQPPRQAGGQPGAPLPSSEHMINGIVRPITEIQADLQAVERETRQALQGIADGESPPTRQADEPPDDQ